jgi:hypothetical protein
MENMTFEERVETVTNKTLELMYLVSNLRRGKEVNFCRIKDLIVEIHSDELELIGIIDDYDLQKSYKCQYSLELPSFMR